MGKRRRLSVIKSQEPRARSQEKKGKLGRLLELSLVVIMGTLFLTSCGGRFACKETLGGTKCESLSEVYEQEVINKGEKPHGENHRQEKNIKEEEKGKNSTTEGSNNNSDIIKKLEAEGRHPLRIPPKVVAVWIAPWEDTEGDLHEQEFIFMEITPKEGRWVLGEKVMDTRGSGFLKKIEDITPPAPEPSGKKSKEKDEGQIIKDKPVPSKSRIENRDLPQPGRKEPAFIR